MRLKLNNGRAASQDAIDVLQQKIGEPLVSDFLEFVAEHDAAEPETNTFKVGTANASGVNGFIPVAEILTETKRIENLPSRSFPVAWAEGGNYVILNQAEKGTVYFWDHEQPDQLVRLSNSFRLFLESLEPFDVSTIKLKPGQVKAAWINPEFLKKLQVGKGVRIILIAWQQQFCY
jgi:hypothetical protein